MSDVINLEIHQLQALVVDALEDIKAEDIRIVEMKEMASFTDLMIIASGGSNRQVKALANNVVVRAKEKGVNVLGMEGEIDAEWILIDLGDVVVHIMQPRIRDFYNLEKLWSVEGQEAAQAPDAV